MRSFAKVCFWVFVGFVLIYGIASGISENGLTSSEYAKLHRAVEIQKCMGIIPRDKDAYEWASELRDQAARIGTDVETLQTMQYAHVAANNPGIGERCAARVDG